MVEVFPLCGAIVAILWIGLRNLYTYMIVPRICVFLLILGIFVMWGLPVSLWSSGRGVGS
jgi:hypothetical protein